MTINQYRFDDYIKAKKENDIHPNITLINNSFNKNLVNLIYYGPDGVGKYSCALNYVSQYSPTGLTYEKKMTVETAKGDIVIKISDVHFEVDMGLLGCNAKQLWNDVIRHIYEVVSLRKERRAFVICKNFHEIHSELLDVFYSYMQTTNKTTSISFIILTNSVCFIPSNIVNRCLKISVPRPSRKTYSMFNKMTKLDDINKISNIRHWKNGNNHLLHDTIVLRVINYITDINETKFDFITLRDHIYDIMVMNHNPWMVMWEIVKKLIIDDKIPEDKVESVIDETYRFLELFNNNYRPIYHLERYVYFLATIVNEL